MIGIRVISMGDDIESRGGMCGELSRGIDGRWDDA